MVERLGVHFEYGYPYFFSSIQYSWPNSPKERADSLKQRLSELEEPLLDKLKEYFEVYLKRKPSPGCPRVNNTGKGLYYHFGDGGRFIEIEQQLGAHFVSEHNLYVIDRAMGFNLGADTLEFLDPKISAPRLNFENGIYSLKYPLPNGLKVFPDPQYLTREYIAKLFKVTNLAPEIEIEKSPEDQMIRTSAGNIKIKDGMCTADTNEVGKAAVLSWVIAKTMNSCRPK